MSAPMKKLRTETVTIGSLSFQVPKETARAVLVLLKGVAGSDEQTVLASESEAIKKLDQKYSRPGACLQGARVKEGMSQVELAEKLGISQSNLSKMELGKRPIGKGMAKRIASLLKIDYRIFM
jgi:ribosome-binding protein aMBF1 (putative translation factor)